MDAPMDKVKYDLCHEAVRTLPVRVQEYYANRYRRRTGSNSFGMTTDAADEIYRYAFYGEKPPRRFREVIRPILVALALAGERD